MMKTCNDFSQDPRKRTLCWTARILPRTATAASSFILRAEKSRLQPPEKLSAWPPSNFPITLSSNSLHLVSTVGMRRDHRRLHLPMDTVVPPEGVHGWWLDQSVVRGSQVDGSYQQCRPCTSLPSRQRIRAYSCHVSRECWRLQRFVP
jgi:hypothetical protein